MNKLFVLIDTSTKTNGKSKCGESIIIWAAWWNEIRDMPYRTDCIYIIHECPNKVFYDGLLRILQSCRHLCHRGKKMIIFGDCKLVMDHVNKKECISGKLLPFYNQAKKLESNFPCRIEYRYVNRENQKYKKIHEITKNFKIFIKNQFKNYQKIK